MGSLTHKAARTAAGLGIDQALKKVTRGDREAELLKLIDLAEKYTSGTNLSIDFTSYRNMLQDDGSAAVLQSSPHGSPLNAVQRSSSSSIVSDDISP